MAVHKYNHKMWLMAIGLYRVPCLAGFIKVKVRIPG